MPAVGSGAPHVVDRLCRRRDKLTEAGKRMRIKEGWSFPHPLLVQHAFQETLSFAGGDGGGRSRAYPGADMPVLGIDRDCEGTDRDHHGVARADLGELLRALRRCDQEGGDELVISHRVPFWPGEELACRKAAAPCGGRQLDPRVRSEPRGG